MRYLLLGLTISAGLVVPGLVPAQTAHRVIPADATSTAASAQASDRPAPAGGPMLRLAAIDTSEAAFRKLDTDHDGRISALEANQNPRVAAAFPTADRDRDGFLSHEEFEALSSAVPKPPDVAASTPDGDAASDPSGDQRATPPSE